ncbi:hypothetical protein [Gracilimonas sp.]|uniref:hypothetical protein n=1 Tax=Gracilimonas sp. TaxID=1974203 RepID=UPI0032F07507
MKTLLSVFLVFSVILFLSHSEKAHAQDFSQLDAVTYNSTSKTWYFFSGQQYLRKKRGEDVEGPFPMSQWDGWDQLRWPKVSSVVYNASSKTYYFFGGPYYARKPYGKPIEAAKPVQGNWENYPTGRVTSVERGGRTWEGPIGPDAVVYNEESKIYYFFKGNFYARKAYGKGFDQPRPTLYTGRSKIIEPEWYEEAGAGIVNGVINLFDAHATGDTENDEYISDGGTQRIPPNNFGTFWPEQWKIANYPQLLNAWKEPKGIWEIAGAVFNPDLNKYYFFVNIPDYADPSNSIGIAYWTKPFGKAEASSVTRIKEGGFAKGWPDF